MVLTLIYMGIISSFIDKEQQVVDCLRVRMEVIE